MSDALRLLAIRLLDLIADGCDLLAARLIPPDPPGVPEHNGRPEKPVSARVEYWRS